MTFKKFIARNVVVLNLTYRPDEDGYVFPPEAHAKFGNPVPVIYDGDYDKIIGTAYIMRVTNSIIADLHVLSGIEDEQEAQVLVQQMYPTISARVLQRYENHILEIDITAISLSFTKNYDSFVPNLGDRVVRERKPVP